MSLLTRILGANWWVEFYSPDQPRVPAGSAAGGQFATTGGGGAIAALFKAHEREPGKAHIDLNPETGPIRYISMVTREPVGDDQELSFEEFDPDAEYETIRFVANHVSDLLHSPDGQALARALDEDAESMIANADRRNGMNIIFTYEAKDVGMGSGGPGSARVFWMPYSLKDKPGWEERTTETDYHYSYALGIDPIYVLGHELHHAYGSHSELDSFSDAIALDMHMALGNKLHPTAVNHELQNKLYAAERMMTGKYGPKITKEARATVRFLAGRHPEAFRQHLLDYGGEEYADYYLKTMRRWRK